MENQAIAVHDVAGGGTASTVSNTVSLVLPAVSGVSLSPDDVVPSGTVPAAAGNIRLFTLRNLANRDDDFHILAPSLTAPASVTGIYYDLNANVLLDAADLLVTPGVTATPMIPAGGTLGVLVEYSAAGVPAGTVLALTLTAESLQSGSANGIASDTGTIRDLVGGGAVFADPAAAGQPPLKTVEGVARVSAAAGTPLQFEIAFANSGTATATNVMVSDPLPAGLLFLPGSLALDALSLTDAADGDAGEIVAGTLRVRIASMSTGEIHRVSFRCQIDPSLPPGLLLANTAQISADGIAPVSSSRAEVLEEPFGIVFQAGTGASIDAATMTLSADPAGTSLCPVPLLPGTGAIPNLNNANPFLTDSSGRYTFLPDTAALGAPGSSLTCYLSAAKTGFLNRLVRVDAVASALSSPSTPIYTLTLSAVDNLPLAPPGATSLVPGPVTLSDVSSVGFNLPLFPVGALVLLKTADRSHAQVGEAVGYRVRVFNSGAVDIQGVVVTDLLPEFTDLVAGASRLITTSGDVGIDPAVSGRNVTFTVGAVAAGEAVEIAYRIRIAPGAPAAAVENLAMVTGTLPNGAAVTAGPARSVVFIRQGIFSFQQALIGRVFEDTNGDGRFDAADTPLPGVRVVLDNGMTSTTDPKGLYSFPSVPEEAHMIGLDPVTYPPGTCPVDEEHRSQHGGSRLLRTPLGGGMLLQQNFILKPGGDCARTGPVDTGKENAHVESPPGAPLDIVPQEQSPATATAAQEPLGPGTHVLEQKEVLPPLREGGLLILDPADGSVALSGGLSLTARTHRSGTVRLSVNDRIVSDQFLGRTDLDDRNQLATFFYVGVPLLPGPNRITVNALYADRDGGQQEELTVYGRGVATLVRITASRATLPADGRSFAELTLELVDAWGNPAQDARLRVQTSLGHLEQEGAEKRDRDVALATRDGRVTIRLAAELATGEAKLTVSSGELAGSATVTFLPAPHPPLLVGLVDATLTAGQADSGVGKDPATPEPGTHGRVSVFYKGPAFPGTLLTTAYNSDQRLNRTTGTDRLFDLDPLLETYPVMGDSSVRFQETLSNSRAYFKLEKERSYLLYGDFTPDMEASRLAGYSRRLTGANLNLLDADGDRLSLAVASPENGFAREVIPGGGISGLYRLGHSPVIPGSETVAVEVHDRRNPEEVLTRRILLRGIDYDLDPLAATLLFKRPLDAFVGPEFDLTEIVVLYEFQTLGLENLTWAGRGQKGFKAGATRLGVSAIGESPDGGDDFRLFAADLMQRLPGAGHLALEVAHSDGVPMILGTSTAGIGSSGSGEAVRLELNERVDALRGSVRLAFSDVDADFLNPYGATVTPGNRRVVLAADAAVDEKVKLGLALQEEENRTDTVDNSRSTVSLKVHGVVSDAVSLTGGVDHRDFTDEISDEKTRSDLLTAGITLVPAPRWRVAARREQNLSEQSDPSYPNSTFLSTWFQQNADLSYFLKYRDSSAPIAAIADLSITGLNPPRSKTELQLGAESHLGSYSTLVSRYQINSGIEGTDSFAVIGLSTRFPLSETFSVDARGEAGYHASGPGESFESVSTGIVWIPVERLRATLRYELRNMDGLGQTLAGGAVGKPSDDVTLLARVEASDASQNGQATTLVDTLAGVAVRPLERDDFGLLFSWRHRDSRQGAVGPGGQVRVLTDTLSTDGVLALGGKVKLFGRVGLTYSEDQPTGLPSVATTTTLLQSRIEYRFHRYFDLAGEARNVSQWQDSLHRNSAGLEWGVWAMDQLRIGIGYRLTQSQVLEDADDAVKSGVYLNFSAKADAILDLFRKKP